MKKFAFASPRTLFLLSVCFGVSSFAATPQAFGQVTPNNIPTPNQPGAIINQLQNPYTGRPDQDRTVTPAEVLQNGGQAPGIENQIPQPRIDESLTRKFRIDDIQVKGNTKLTQEEIDAIVRPYEGTDTSFTDLQDNVADKLTALYEQKGYITALAYIPPQTITGGVIVVQIDEGRVSEVTLQDTRWFKARAVMPRLDVKEGDVFKVEDLQRSLRRINENPDLVLQATLRAGEKSGETEVVLTPRRENFFVHLTPFIDNLGRPIIGNTRYGVTLTDNNTLGFGDTLFSSPFWTKDSFGIVNGYELPLGPHGTKLGFVNAHTNFDFEREGFDFKGHSNINTPYISQELYRSENMILTGELGLGIKDSTFEIDDTGFETTDRVRALTPALNLQTFDKWGRNFVRQEFAFGLNIFNATERHNDRSSRPGASGKFFRYTATASRLQRLPWGTYGILKVIGQATPDALFSLEQIQIGGAATVRGYQEGRLIGDRGWVVSAEWRIPMRFIPAQAKVGKYQLNQNLELVSFIDAGGVYDHHTFAGVNPQSGRVKDNAHLLGIGVGLRAYLTRFLSARLDVGFPLIKQDPDRDSARVHFGVESRLF